MFSPILVENQFHPQFDNFILHVKVQHLFQTLVVFKKILLMCLVKKHVRGTMEVKEREVLFFCKNTRTKCYLVNGRGLTRQDGNN